MSNKKLKVLLFAITLLLVLTLVACNTPIKPTDDTTTDDDDNGGATTVTSVRYALTENEMNVEVVFYSDMKFEFSLSEEDGISKYTTTGNGTYTSTDDGYKVTFTSLVTRNSLFSLVYEEEVFSDYDIAQSNESLGTIKRLSDTAYQFVHWVLFLDGDKGTRGTILDVTTQAKFSGQSEYEFVCDIDDTIENAIIGEYLLLIHADGYKEYIKITADMVGELDTSTAGVKEVVITYAEGKTHTAQVSVGGSSPYLYTNIKDFITLGTTLEEFRNNDSNKLYTDEGIIYLTNSEVTITGFNAATTGRITLTITYKGLSVNTDIQVYDPDNLKDISLYVDVDLGCEKGQELEFEASVDKDNGDDEAVESNLVTVSGFDNTKNGAQLVTFTYGSLTYKTVVFVYDDTTKDTVIGISIERQNSEGAWDIVLTDGALDFSNHKLGVTAIDGSMKYIDLTESMFIGYSAADLQSAGFGKSYTLKYTSGGYNFYVSEFLRMPYN